MPIEIRRTRSSSNAKRRFGGGRSEADLTTGVRFNTDENGPSAGISALGPLHGFHFSRHLQISVVQQHNQDNQRNRYSKEPKKNGHGVFLSGWLLTTRCFFAPCAISQTASLHGR
jgi:hypothetical protein